MVKQKRRCVLIPRNRLGGRERKAGGSGRSGRNGGSAAWRLVGVMVGLSNVGVVLVCDCSTFGKLGAVKQ